jgi:ABC-2 type transport system permease protein
MRKVLLIALRDYNAAVRTKGFIIGLVVMPILLGGGLIGVKLMESQRDIRDKRIAIVDHSGTIAQAVAQAAERRNTAELRDTRTGKQVRPAYLIEIVLPDEKDPSRQRLELSERVRAHSLTAFVEMGKDAVDPARSGKTSPISYHAENPAMDDARRWLEQPINDRIRQLRLAAAGLSVEKVSQITRWVWLEPLSLVEVDETTGKIKGGARRGAWEAIGVPYAVMLLMFIFMMTAATPLINTILEEKMNRVAEVLLGSVSPFQLMMGKLLGGVAVSLTTVLVYVGGGIAAAHYMSASSSIPYRVLPWLLVYGIGAALMYGAIFIAFGATCNDLRESQTLLMPVWMLVVAPMFIFLPVVKEPASSLALWSSFFPPFTPMLMLLRQTTPGGIPAWQPWVGLAGVIGFTVLCVWAAGRIFRVGILMQGKPPRLTEILKWAARG